MCSGKIFMHAFFEACGKCCLLRLWQNITPVFAYFYRLKLLYECPGFRKDFPG